MSNHGPITTLLVVVALAAVLLSQLARLYQGRRTVNGAPTRIGWSPIKLRWVSGTGTGRGNRCRL
jgi:hypothetical protein